MTTNPVGEQPMRGYIAPMATFLVLTAMESWLPSGWYPLFYAGKVAVVSGCLLYFREPLTDIRPRASVVLPAIVTGTVVFLLWVGIETLVTYPHVGARIGYNPFDAIDGTLPQFAFIAVRLYGLVLVVPVMEELFWRAFLARYLTNENFRSVSYGGFSWTAFIVVTALFASAHPEWLAATVTAVLYGLLVRQTSSVFAAIVAHATTNAALGAYVLIARDWVFW